MQDVGFVYNLKRYNRRRTTQCCEKDARIEVAKKTPQNAPTAINSAWDINQSDFLHQQAGQYEEVLLDR
ncbi:hypothetical protein F2P81_010437 [Scophthalmus maximus]|uniref:Uncharacterized protein n=1 Tax=Scophthalmus maximus TaxID=52904 RepID=A0A6A4SUC3_SCOMX|nr:hypothetical protein F2P81_010437 [Scophthalmus maximus]